LICEHCRELFQIERIPLRGLTDTVDDQRRRMLPEQVQGDSPRSFRRQRSKGRGDGVWLAHGPRGALLEEFGPGEAQHEHGTVHPINDRIEKVDHRRFRPMQIFDYDHQRRFGGHDLEQTPHRPGSLRRERLTDAEDLGDTVPHRGTIGLVGHPLTQRRRYLFGISPGSPGSLREQLDEWRERDAVAVSRCLSHQHGCMLAHRSDE